MTSIMDCILSKFLAPSGQKLIGLNSFCNLSVTLQMQAGSYNNLQLQEEQAILQQMAWPPQSQNLNIMESVCDYMKKEATETA